MSDNDNPVSKPVGRFSRRDVIRGAVVGALGISTYAAAQSVPADPKDSVDLSQSRAFYGNAEQAGIRTPPQRYTFYMTFDLTSAQRTDLQVLLARWSGAIAQLMKGKTIGQVEPAREYGVGFDTGEALDLGPASLTVTVGLGPRIFTDTYGLQHPKTGPVARVEAIAQRCHETGINRRRPLPAGLRG